jgi:hypothetical protein
MAVSLLAPGLREDFDAHALVAILADTEQHASERADYLKRRADTRP